MPLLKILSLLLAGAIAVPAQAQLAAKMPDQRPRPGNYAYGQWGTLLYNQSGGNILALVDGSTIPVNAGLANVFTLTITGASHTISNPINLLPRQFLTFIVTENGTGGYTPLWGSNYTFPSGTPVFNTAASAVNTVSCVSTSPTALVCYGGLLPGGNVATQ